TPHLRSFGQALLEWLRQSTMVAVGAAPAVACLSLIPWIGQPLALAATAVWIVHWSFVEALDSARALPEGTGRDDDASVGPPWYVQMHTALYRQGWKLFWPARIWG